MIEQWQELKETIIEMRDNDGTGTQQDVCKFLVDYMEVLEKQMQESTYAKGTIIKSTLKYLVKRQIEEGSVGFAVDNDPDHDCCWDDVLAWIEAQPTDARPWGTKLGTWIERTVIHKDEAKEAIEEWQSARCSVCGKYHTTPYMYYFDEFKYCPNCGAEMSGGGEDGNSN